MILMYHKVDVVTPSKWWVSAQTFKKQMHVLARSFRVVTLDQYDPSNPSLAVVTFDDAYENVYRHAFPVLRDLQFPFELFVIGDLLGDWNDFDPGELKTRFCSRDQLVEMANSRARIQWHTRSHHWLPNLKVSDLCIELNIPRALRREFPSPHFRWFSYPYGAHDRRIRNEVRQRFAGAVSVAASGGELDRYVWPRITVNERWMPHRRVSRSLS